MMYSEPTAPGLTGLRKHIGAHPKSPLVVRFAAALIDAGEYNDALQLSRAALEQFPNYPTLHLVIARAQVAMQQFAPARNRLQSLLTANPACMAATQLIERIERLERQSLLEGGQDNKGIPDVRFTSPEQQERQKKMNWSWREHLIPGEDAILSKRAKDFELNEQQDAAWEAPSEPAPAATEPEARDSVSEFEEAFARGIDLSIGGMDEDDTDLERLAGQLDAASMPRISETDQSEQPGPEFEAVNLESRPVTETLAEIYVKQGKLAEAIDAYRKLREANRDKRYEYTVRISEIKRLIDERSGDDR